MICWVDQLRCIQVNNWNVVCIVCKGSINYEQYQFVLEIFGLCGIIKLEIEWIFRIMNIIVDESSKIYDYDDWRVLVKKYV